MKEVRTLAQLLSALKHGYTVRDGKLVPPPSPRKEETGWFFCISIAGHCVGIHTRFSDLHTCCRDYLCDGKPEVEISADENDLARERDEAKKEKTPQGNDSLESLVIHRKISEAMLDWDTFLMHGAVVAVEQSAYMFTAVSGTGKTTHIHKWLDNIPDAYVVNGDKPLIQIKDTGAAACGTPWCGKERMGTNAKVPLKAIVLMQRGENNIIREISFGEAFSFLLHQTYRPSNPEKLKKALVLLSQLKGKVRFYRFAFNNLMDDCFDVAYSALTKGHV